MMDRIEEIGAAIHKEQCAKLRAEMDQSEVARLRAEVESALAEHRKHVLLEAVAVARQEAYVNQTAYIVFEKLRRMAEGEKSE